jgi:hypothetical protein
VYSLSVFNVNLLRGQSVIFLVHHVLSSPCTGFNLQALPQGYSYAGPTSDDNTTCKCSTVVYSLLSACDACQGQSWPEYVSHPPLALWAYHFLVGINILPNAQMDSLPHRESTVVVRGFPSLTENTLPVSLIPFLEEYACPIGRLLISQFVTHLSSSLSTDRISQIEGNWDYSQSYTVGGRNALLSPSSSSILRSPFQIFLKSLVAG